MEAEAEAEAIKVGSMCDTNSSIVSLVRDCVHLQPVVCNVTYLFLVNSVHL